MIRWLVIFVVCTLAGAALANDLMMMGIGPRAPAAGGAASCLVLEADGTSKILLEDGTGCIALES